MFSKSAFTCVYLKKQYVYALRPIFLIGALYTILDVYQSIVDGVTVQRGGGLIFADDAIGFWLRVTHKILIVLMCFYIIYRVRVKK